jgi:hypothetical protein
MKISFDVYTKNLDNATMAYTKLDPATDNIRLGKQKRYNTESHYYNVYGDIDTKEISVLHDAFKEGFVDDSDDV